MGWRWLQLSVAGLSPLPHSSQEKRRAVQYLRESWRLRVRPGTPRAARPGSQSRNSHPTRAWRNQKSLKPPVTTHVGMNVHEKEVSENRSHRGTLFLLELVVQFRHHVPCRLLGGGGHDAAGGSIPSKMRSFRQPKRDPLDRGCKAPPFRQP